MVNKIFSKDMAILIGFLILSLTQFVFPKETKIGTEVDVMGVRTNYLTGYGIVVGLSGTGDGTTSRFTLLSIANMLRKMGIFIDPNQVRTKNAAAVIVTANMPPFAKSGMRFDVTVASIGDAKDIGNGVLIRTPLFGPDGKVYAFAQGSVSTGGGFTVSNRGGKVQKNFSTTGVVINGGIVERDLPFNLENVNRLKLTLKHPDFSRAFTIQEAINRAVGKEVARALDSSTVELTIPKGQEPVSFLSKVLDIKIKTDTEPVVVIYERTGTVIMSGDIKIDTPVYVSHGNIYVAVVKRPVVSQPPPLSAGQTVATEQVQTKVVEESGRIFSIESPKLKDLVKALNELGVSPRDLIAIIQAIKNAGKLHAKIVVM